MIDKGITRFNIFTIAHKCVQAGSRNQNLRNNRLSVQVVQYAEQ